jgi:hypothetical protein
MRCAQVPRASRKAAKPVRFAARSAGEIYSHALRATSMGIAQSREARPFRGAERRGDRS